jgi:hypothetical protein
MANSLSGLKEILGVGQPENGRQTVDLTPEQALLLKAQFLPFMENAAQILKSWGHENDDPNVQELRESFGNPAEPLTISGQISEDFAFYSETQGKTTRRISWLKGDDEIIVTNFSTEDISNGRGFNTKTKVPVGPGDVTVTYKS